MPFLRDLASPRACPSVSPDRPKCQDVGLHLGVFSEVIPLQPAGVPPMPLKELEARYATSPAKDYKLADEGLYLLVHANGSSCGA